MPSGNSRHSESTRVPVEKRRRTPHRSGQEYELGETPRTGLGGEGDAIDLNAQCARVIREDRGDGEVASDPSKSTRQSGGDEERGGFGDAARGERGASPRIQRSDTH